MNWSKTGIFRAKTQEISLKLELFIVHSEHTETMGMAVKKADFPSEQYHTV